MEAPKKFGASTLAPLARPVVRGGRTLEAPEPVSKARERAIAGRRALPQAVTHLRHPAPYRVELSTGLQALIAAR
jgi:nicotinate phosphoribosyltransferase